MIGFFLLVIVGLISFTMTIIDLLPKTTTEVPASLVAIIVVTVLVHGFNIDTRVVGDLASVSGGFL